MGNFYILRTKIIIGMIVEFRIPLPLGVDDFEIAQLYAVLKLQENITGGGEGIIILKNEPYLRKNIFNNRYDNVDGHLGISPISKVPIPKDKGQYTLKHYLIGSMIPSFAKRILPKGISILIYQSHL